MKAVILTIMGASLAITGCASLSKAECQVADWYQIGLPAKHQSKHK